MKKIPIFVFALLLPRIVVAQTPVVVSYLDFIKFDALKVDSDKVGFKVQIQMDTQTTTWSDVPAASLGSPSVLPDTLADSVTYQVAISPSTPLGVHTLRLRYCAPPVGGTVASCGEATSIQFDLRSTTPPVVLGIPKNIRFGPKSGG